MQLKQYHMEAIHNPWNNKLKKIGRPETSAVRADFRIRQHIFPLVKKFGWERLLLDVVTQSDGNTYYYEKQLGRTIAILREE